MAAPQPRGHDEAAARPERRPRPHSAPWAPAAAAAPAAVPRPCRDGAGIAPTAFRDPPAQGPHPLAAPVMPRHRPAAPAPAPSPSAAAQEDGCSQTRGQFSGGFLYSAVRRLKKTF
ncbi:oleosin-B6-like [Neopelma chrysocephalum]|uniref:oleosin-B6-like n=1 Tax=Neopelma chrysocephalum TaxID=114329 RepID=UPI000FCD2EB9|nr:oleosin-B6-like [Neopelma chrysocephalum]